MAPPTTLFPVSELESKVQVTSVNFKEKRRKIQDFDLERCELFELVQYSCTTLQQTMQQALTSERGNTRMECMPFIRLFRRCGKGNKMFHVETTAWEGEHAYVPQTAKTVQTVEQVVKQQPAKSENGFAVGGT